ncbi:hypothetical protein LINGRAHAP2_LOCUS36503 [Linum grandiflorum]
MTYSKFMEVNNGYEIEVQLYIQQLRMM